MSSLISISKKNTRKKISRFRKKKMKMWRCWMMIFLLNC